MKKLLLILTILFGVFQAQAQINCSFQATAGVGQTVNFNHLWVPNPTQTLDSAVFDYGDGNTQSFLGPIMPPISSHTYATPGFYYVCVTSFSSSTLFPTQIICNSCDTVQTGTAGPCSAFISTVVNGSTVVATGSATGGSGPYSYQYTLNPGNITNATGIFSGLANGTYAVCVTALDAMQNLCSVACDTATVNTTTSCSTTLTTIPLANSITAVGNATGGQAPYTYSYTLLPGNITNTTGIFNGLTSGWYAVCVTATDALNQVCSTACDSAFVTGSTSCSTSITATSSGNTITAVGSATGGQAPYTYVYGLTPGNITNNTGIFTGLQNGFYTVCVIAYDSLQAICSTACDSLQVGGTTSSCSTSVFATATGNTVNAVASATGGQGPYTYSYTINPGNITNSTGMFPGLAQGFYTVCATATDSLNVVCSTVCDTAFVVSPTLCSTTVTATVGVSSITATATATGGIPPYSYSYTLWPNNIVNTTGVFTGLMGGNYVVCATATDAMNNLCYSSMCDSVIVAPQAPCFANASFTQSTSGLTTSFTNTTTCNSCTSLVYNWDFGDGNSSALTNPVHSYAATGIYLVTLNVVAIDTNNTTCMDSDTMYITITNSQPPCVANLSHTTVGNVVSFTTTLNNVTVPVTYTFNLGDGSPLVTQSTGSITHTYPTNNLYNACVTVRDSATTNILCISCDSFLISSNIPPCSTSLTTAVNGSSVTATATGTGGSAPYTYIYTLNPGNLTNTTGIFSNLPNGQYTICGIAMDSTQAICSSACDTVTIFVTPPCSTTLNSTFSTTPIGWTIVGNATATGGNPGYTYSYTLNPGNITNTTGVFSGIIPGQYFLCATAYDSLQQICSTDCDSISINTPGPCNTILNSTVNGSTIVGVAFASGGVGPYTYSYTLNPGNITNTTGIFSNLTNGQYFLCATAYDSLQQICSTDCDSLTVGGFGPCSTTLNSTVNGSTIIGSAFATGSVGPYTYTYTLNPGNITNTTGIFSNLSNGQYYLCATAIDTLQQVCSMDCDSLTVGSLAPCSTTISSVANGSTIVSTATSFGGAAPYSYTYTLNPGNISNTTGIFSNVPNGAYAVCVVATDAMQQTCSVSCDSVLVGAPGNCAVNAAFTPTISGLNVTFTNNTTITGGVLTNHAWSFGDGNVANTVNAIHTYAASGTYTVTLVSAGFDAAQNPCIDSISQTIMVGATSVNNVSADKLAVYPNPTAQNFVIELPTNEKFEKLVITDVSGRIIATNPTSSANDKLLISLENNSSGIYFIKLQTDKNFYTSSIMKQE